MSGACSSVADSFNLYEVVLARPIIHRLKAVRCCIGRSRKSSMVLFALRTARLSLAKFKVLLEIFSAVALAAASRLIRSRTGEVIHLNLSLNERQSAYLAVALAETGAIACPPRQAPHMLRLLSAALYAKSVGISWKSKRGGCIITDKHRHTVACRHTIYIERDYYSSEESTGQKVMPYFAHPEFYRRGLYKAAHKLRQNRRSVRIFFAGTYSRDAYASDFDFPILTRADILEFISSRFKAEIRSGQIGLEITSDTRDALCKHSLAPEDYLKRISEADFFICPPGWRMPHSHNMIEAMSVGTIPITNYSQYVKPSMNPGCNCIAFDTIEDLEGVLLGVLKMTIPEIDKMREHVISYYDAFLDPRTFGLDLRSSIGAVNTLLVNDESGQ